MFLEFRGLYEGWKLYVASPRLPFQLSGGRWARPFARWNVTKPLRIHPLRAFDGLNFMDCSNLCATVIVLT